MNTSNKRTNWLLLILLLLPLTLLTLSCGNSRKLADTSYSASALYDPPCVHLIDGQEYQFVEGKLIGRKNHIFYSDPTYRMALQLGKESQWKPLSTK